MGNERCSGYQPDSPGERGIFDKAISTPLFDSRVIEVANQLPVGVQRSPDVNNDGSILKELLIPAVSTPCGKYHDVGHFKQSFEIGRAHV